MTTRKKRFSTNVEENKDVTDGVPRKDFKILISVNIKYYYNRTDLLCLNRY